MKNTQIAIKFLVLAVLLVATIFSSGRVLAQEGVIDGQTGDQGSGSIGTGVGSGEVNSGAPPKESVPITDICGNGIPDVPGVDVPVVDENGQVGEDNCDCDAEVLDPDNCEFVKYVEVGINLMSAAAALAIVGGMMTGAYMYMTARDNPGQTAAGRQRIVWALVALLILIFFYAFLQWLVPGGILGQSTAPDPEGLAPLP